MNNICPPRLETKLLILAVISTLQNMHIPRHKYQLTLHSLSEIQLYVNNLSETGMKSISQSAKLNSLRLISRQLGDIPQIFLKVTTE